MTEYEGLYTKCGAALYPKYLQYKDFSCLFIKRGNGQSDTLEWLINKVTLQNTHTLGKYDSFIQ